MKRGKQAQGINMTIAAPETCPRYIWPELGLGKELRESPSVNHLPIRFGAAKLIMEP
jgi:hypothetical protein